MIKRLLNAFVGTAFVLLAMPFIFFGFASMLMFDTTPVIFAWERLLEFPQFELSIQAAIVFASMAVFLMIAIFSSKE